MRRKEGKDSGWTNLRNTAVQESSFAEGFPQQARFY